MANVLAQEAYFGEEEMVQCAAQGYGNKPGFPATKLQELICKLYPGSLKISQDQVPAKIVKEHMRSKKGRTST